MGSPLTRCYSHLQLSGDSDHATWSVTSHLAYNPFLSEFFMTTYSLEGDAWTGEDKRMAADVLMAMENNQLVSAALRAREGPAFTEESFSVEVGALRFLIERGLLKREITPECHQAALAFLQSQTYFPPLECNDVDVWDTYVTAIDIST